VKQVQNGQGHMAAPKVYLVAFGLALGFGVLFQWFFFANVPGVAFPIFAGLFMVCSWWLAMRAKIAIPKIVLPLAAVLFIFSCFVAVRGGSLLTLLNIAVSLYLYSLMLYVTFRPVWRDYAPRDYLAPITQVPIEVLKNIKVFLSRLKPLQTVASKHPAAPRVLRGVALALPLLLVFVLLFSSADLVFRKYVADIVTIDVNADLLFRLVWAAVMVLAACGVYGAMLHGSLVGITLRNETARPVRDVEVKIVLGSLNVLFLTFIIIQLAYLFGGAHALASTGFTYAQYARKGFFELITAAVLSLSVIAMAGRYAGYGAAGRQRWFRLLAGGLAVQVLIMMVSAFKRLALYEGAYGFTTLRIYSHLCIIWLALAFGLLLYALFVAHREKWLGTAAVVSMLAFLLVANVGNVDAFVARKNIGRYYATGKLDVGYLAQLSDDAIPEVVKLLPALPDDSRNRLAGSLYQRRQDIGYYERHWQSWNAAREAGIHSLDSQKQLLMDNQDLRVSPGSTLLGN
jgi:hypothetical protein